VQARRGKRGGGVRRKGERKGGGFRRSEYISSEESKFEGGRKGGKERITFSIESWSRQEEKGKQESWRKKEGKRANMCVVSNLLSIERKRKKGSGQHHKPFIH